MENKYYINGQPVSEEEYIEKGILNTSDYVWLRVLPEDFYEEGIDAIWCKKEDIDKNPINIGDQVEYTRPTPYPYPGPAALGKVIAIFESIDTAPIISTYFAHKPE